MSEPTTTPPMEDEFLWYREDRIFAAMQDALNAAIRTHGNKSKAFAWDVKGGFKQQLRKVSA